MPPLCKGRWAKSLILLGGIVRKTDTIPQFYCLNSAIKQLPAGSPVGGSDSPLDCHSLPPTALRLPFTQGGRCVIPITSGDINNNFMEKCAVSAGLRQRIGFLIDHNAGMIVDDLISRILQNGGQLFIAAILEIGFRIPVENNIVCA